VAASGLRELQNLFNVCLGRMALSSNGLTFVKRACAGLVERVSAFFKDFLTGT
jgi:hypothetical protein